LAGTKKGDSEMNYIEHPRPLGKSRLKEQMAALGLLKTLKPKPPEFDLLIIDDLPKKQKEKTE